MIYHRNAQGERGYTLVELSVVIGIIAILVGTTLSLGTARINQQKITSTKDRITLIERALKNYAEVNNRLPCPADGRLNRGDVGFGLAAGPEGDCTTGTISAPRAAGNIVSGTVPINDLALPEDIMFDNWGRKFTYAVDIRHTRIDSFKYNLQNSTCGSIIIADEADSPITTNGMFVLLSHGEDGHGAYHSATAAPWQLNASINNEATLDNAGLDAANADDFDGRYRVMGFFEDGDDANNRFDDIIRYKTRKDWRLTQDIVNENFKLNSKPTITGWTYVPQYTLPSGKVVPAFEVMQYLASDADADGVPESVPDEAPLAGLPFDDARQYCQKLGYNAGMGVTGDGTLMEYDIISETQSASIAHQALDDSRNWVDSCFGDDFVVAGHRDSAPSSHLAGGPDVSEGYYLTGNSANDATAQDRAQRRTIYLPSGSALWDMSGNGNQWSYCDWDYAEGENQYRTDNFADNTAYSLCVGNGLTNRDKFTDGLVTDNLYYEYNDPVGIDKDTNNGKLIDILPKYGYDNDEFLGAFKGHSAATTGVTRSSSYDASSYTGIFRIITGYGDGATPYARVFRCAHNFQGTEFSPRNLEGLDIWYDASDIDADFEEEWTATTVEEDPALLNTAGATCNTTDNICVQQWSNKASNGKWNARSKALNGALFGSDTAMPTFKLNAINGRPAINFSETTAQFFDTWHGTVNGADDGTGYSFNTSEEFTVFVVANAEKYDSILAASDQDANWWPYFMYFPYDMGNKNGNQDYVLLTNLLMAGDDATNDFCKMSDVETSLPNCEAAHTYEKLYESGPHTIDGTIATAETAPHTTNLEVAEARVEITFTADTITPFRQGLFSKDHEFFGTGGHLSFWLLGDDLQARIQDNVSNSYYVDAYDVITPGVEYNVAYEFGTNGLKLFINDVLMDTDPYTGGITTNSEWIVIGGNNWQSTAGTTNNIQDPFDGTIHKVLMYGGSNSDGVNYACAKMGGIENPDDGLTANQTHIATGIFKKGLKNGLTAYVDGATQDVEDSSVEAEDSALNNPAKSCGGDAVDMKLAIGANRNNTDVRTIGNVAEIIIYNRALTNKERIQVEKYLSEKYGVAYKGPRGKQ